MGGDARCAAGEVGLCTTRSTGGTASGTPVVPPMTKATMNAIVHSIAVVRRHDRVGGPAREHGDRRADAYPRRSSRDRRRRADRPRAASTSNSGDEGVDTDDADRERRAGAVERRRVPALPPPRSVAWAPIGRHHWQGVVVLGGDLPDEGGLDAADPGLRAVRGGLGGPRAVQLVERLLRRPHELRPSLEAPLARREDLEPPIGEPPRRWTGCRGP